MLWTFQEVHLSIQSCLASFQLGSIGWAGQTSRLAVCRHVRQNDHVIPETVRSTAKAQRGAARDAGLGRGPGLRGGEKADHCSPGLGCFLLSNKCSIAS